VIIECDYCGASDCCFSKGMTYPRSRRPSSLRSLSWINQGFSPGTLGFAVAVALVIPIAVVPVCSC
jgi:hypothetical protein